MDFQTPEMDGLEATQRIRAGERVHGDRECGIDAGTEGYVSKPIDARAQQEEIRRVRRVRLDRR